MSLTNKITWILLCLISALPVVPADPEPPEASGGNTFEPGTPGIVRTVLSGSEIVEIPLEYVGTLTDFSAPGRNLHIVRLAGEFAEHVGVAAGMSGSPVYLDGELIGALAYRLGTMPKDAMGGVTPIAEMLNASRAGMVDSSSALGLHPIRTPVLTSGMAGEVREWLADQFTESGMVLVGGGESGSSQISNDLEPGSPVGLGLVLGDMTIAATGTVTYVEDDQIYAFGHPLLGSGSVEIPMLSAEVIVMLADGLGSIRLASVGTERGAILEDRLTAVIGRTDRTAEMIPLTLHVRDADSGEERFDFKIVNDKLLAPSLIGATVANSLYADLLREDKTTMLASGAVSFADLPDLPLEMAFAGEGRNGPALAIADYLRQIMALLWSNPIAELKVERVDLDIDVSNSVKLYQIDSLLYDRGPLHPGDTLEVTCVLRKYRGETLTRKFSLTVPAGLDASSAISLAVGAPQEIEKALGYPVTRRLRSSEGLESAIESLADWRSQHRLTAVLLQRSRGVFTRGVALADLPPTAEHLLSRRAAVTETAHSYVSPLVRAEVELDGPVSGGLAVQLRLEPAQQKDEEKP